MKKIFRLTAMAAMVSMMATSVCVSSCSDDDDDDDTTETVVYTKNFSGKVGGSASSEGSFISVMDGDIYKLSDLKANAELIKHVEIVFDGSKFVSASEAGNEDVAANGNAAIIKTVTKGKKYEFTTAPDSENGKAYSGIIEITDGEVGSASATVSIKVSAK